ncbi:Protein transport protein [Actinidia chinensis var. chinensis]|uniref:Protein transport protein n=1 Tax=Actinidia chinensis var. chinensis TaxID=1590841 RepID=A0A2R6Q122_ACTCC|nr:Protein transport protein [Actinidia chinensis var. chinensis]
MGSSEEEKLIQMVTDFIESEGSPIPTSPKPQKTQHKPTISTLQDVVMRVTNAETLILEKILIYLRDMEFTGEAKNLKKLIVLKLVRDGFEASLCITSWFANFGRPSVFKFRGDYEYVDVMMTDLSHGGEAVRLIVDMDFRSQFELARPTSTYSDLLTSLPSIFVGTEEKLVSILSLLCSAAKQSLRERGLHMPPWRKANYMQSKWLSYNCKKITFTNS